jgi:hypothetical protein
MPCLLYFAVDFEGGVYREGKRGRCFDVRIQFGCCCMEFGVYGCLGRFGLVLVLYYVRGVCY